MPQRNFGLEGDTPRLLRQRAYQRMSYYLRPEQIKALKLRAVMEEKDSSALVRQAIDQLLAKKT